MRSEFSPGDTVTLASKPEWGLGQVQSALGEKITVMFQHAGKVVVNTATAALLRADDP